MLAGGEAIWKSVLRACGTLVLLGAYGVGHFFTYIAEQAAQAHARNQHELQMQRAQRAQAELAQREQEAHELHQNRINAEQLRLDQAEQERHMHQS